MKILSILTSPGPGGAEMLVRNLSAEFVERGHECLILFMSDAPGVGNPPEFERDFLAGVAASGAAYEVMGRGSFGNPVKAALELRRCVRRFAPDLVHAHVARAMVARSLSGLKLPTIFTHHNVTANFPVALFRLFDVFADRYVAIGRAAEAFLRRHVRGQIAYIPNGVPASFAAAEPRTDLPRNPSVLSVGNLTPQKSYVDLVDAAAIVVRRLAAEGREVRFAVAGEGSERARIEARIAARGLADRFELLGARPDVPDLMRRADLLVNSSVHEGLPITLIEAAMSGLPIVATDVGGNSEVVEDGGSGFLAPASRPDLLAERICTLLSDAARYAAFSERGRAIGERFTLGACAEAHLSLYREVLGSSRSG